MTVARHTVLFKCIAEAHDRASSSGDPRAWLTPLAKGFMQLTDSQFGALFEISGHSGALPVVEGETTCGSIHDRSKVDTLLNAFLAEISEGRLTAQVRVCDGMLLYPILFQHHVVALLIVGGGSGYPEESIDFLEPLIKTTAFLLDRMKTERVRAFAEQELRRSESFLDSIIKNIPNMVFVKEARELRFVLFNNAGKELLGIGAEQLIGKNDYDFFPKEQADFFVEKDREVLRGGKLLEIPEEEINTQRGIRILHTKKIPILDAEGNPRYLLGISDDITDRKAMQKTLNDARDQALAASKAKSEFLANMSHEIRTPMSGIIGMIDLLGDIGVSPVHEEYLSAIRTSAHALLTIINDILDFSKVEAGRLELSPSPVALRKMIRNLELVFGVKATETGVRLAVVVEPNVPTHCLTDEQRLLQILNNLLGNAIKFTGQGGAVSLRVARSGDDRLEFTVADSGIGIASDKLGMIFEAFSQADPSISRMYGGTGLGLAISSQLVRLLGGKMGVESTPGVGSTFRFTLPFVAVPSDHKDTSPEEELPNPPPHSYQGTILVAEDNEINQRLMAHILTRLGFNVVLVRNGEEAVAAVRERVPDLILMDVQMPVMDGLAATSKIRLLQGAHERRVPIIALTAHALDGYKEVCLEAGMDDYLSKPVLREELIKKLAHYLPQEQIAGHRKR